MRVDYHCPQRRLCNCYVAFYTKEYAHKIDLYAAGTHTSESHIRSSARLSQHQKHAISTAVGASPLSTGYSVHRNLGNVGMEVSNDKATRAAVNRLVRKERSKIMHAETGGKKMDANIAAMVEIGRMLQIEKLIEKHNSDSGFHLDLHTVISGGFDFEDNEVFIHTSTPHLSNNMARAEECGWPTQLHIDGLFNVCSKDFGVIGLGMNSMGAKLNAVSLSLAGTESAEMIDRAYEASLFALHKLYEPPPTGPKLCNDPNCGFCSMLKHHNSGKWKAFLATDAGKAKKFDVKKPSSDNTNIFFGWGKRKFGDATKIHQCGAHATGQLSDFFYPISILIIIALYLQLFHSRNAPSGNTSTPRTIGCSFISCFPDY